MPVSVAVRAFQWLALGDLRLLVEGGLGGFFLVDVVNLRP